MSKNQNTKKVTPTMNPNADRPKIGFTDATQAAAFIDLAQKWAVPTYRERNAKGETVRTVQIVSDEEITLAKDTGAQLVETVRAMYSPEPWASAGQFALRGIFTTLVNDAHRAVDQLADETVALRVLVDELSPEYDTRVSNSTSPSPAIQRQREVVARREVNTTWALAALRGFIDRHRQIYNTPPDYIVKGSSMTGTGAGSALARLRAA